MWISYGSELHHYDPVSGTACLAELRASEKSPTFCDLRADAVPSCSTALFLRSKDGLGQPGEACGGTCGAPGEACSGGCAPGTSYVACSTNGTSQGVCQTTELGKEGDGPCVGTMNDEGILLSAHASVAHGFLCEGMRGLYCDTETSKCSRRKPAGATCRGPHECEVTALCNKTCTPRLKLGNRCDQGSGFQSCPIDGYCDWKTKTCVPLVSAGGPCESNTDCVSKTCETTRKCEPGGRAGIFHGSPAFSACAPK